MTDLSPARLSRLAQPALQVHRRPRPCRTTNCVKVSLGDLFYPKTGRRTDNQAYRNKINRKHIDFLLCEWWDVLEEKFERRLSFSPETWMGQAFQGIRSGEPVPVEIEFDAYQAPWICEQSWPQGYEIDDLDNGGLILRFETGRLEGVKMWVMQYGPHAEVLQPPELRAEVAEELRLALERYELDKK